MRYQAMGGQDLSKGLLQTRCFSSNAENVVVFCHSCGALAHFFRLHQLFYPRIARGGTPLPNEGHLSGRIP